MNKRIRNGALFGLIISIALGLLLANYTATTYEGDLTIIHYLPVYDYVVAVLRFGAIGTLIGMFIAWRKNKAEDEGPKTYYGEVFLGVFFMFSAMAALTYLWS
ncbi:hypothetical protein DVB69_00080 [Sporosarcina sp. BI001-red]|uniref:hypothetical protein n=1 Tax=Sporosarcina sp. BI001-red TaxID=2282866 RepID=UPI000E24C283|nr:hypothetical protein [Sporosarcina sp. BI001-red]REB11579.1 hypothetical protein DVB69_00080 [Sporosarcina sp. BI001-red]